jgi:hypothetical protein
MIIGYAASARTAKRLMLSKRRLRPLGQSGHLPRKSAVLKRIVKL